MGEMKKKAILAKGIPKQSSEKRNIKKIE